MKIYLHDLKVNISNKYVHLKRFLKVEHLDIAAVSRLPNYAIAMQRSYRHAFHVAQSFDAFKFTEYALKWIHLNSLLILTCMQKKTTVHVDYESNATSAKPNRWKMVKRRVNKKMGKN